MSNSALKAIARRAPSGYFTEGEEADRLRISLRTLRRWRASGEGPAITKLGRTVYYSEHAERDYLASAEKPVALPAPRRRGRAG